MRLIDANLLKAEFTGNFQHEYQPAQIKAIIDCAPTVEAVLVIRGHWVYDPNAMDWGLGGYVCSKCGVRNNNLPGDIDKNYNTMMFSGARYCPHCGAKMEFEDKP